MPNYHPTKRENRAIGAEGSFSPKASIPASTPVTIDATAAHVDTTIALPCFKPCVYLQHKKDITHLKGSSTINKGMNPEFSTCFTKTRKIFTETKELAVDKLLWLGYPHSTH